MIDIYKIEDLFFDKLGCNFIKFTSMYTNIDDDHFMDNYYEISQRQLINGIENIVERDWYIKPLLTFELDKICGTQIEIDEFIGPYFDEKSNSLLLRGLKQWYSHYFIYPYEENFKLRVNPPKIDLNTTPGFSSCFDSEKRKSNIELNNLFLEIKKELLEIETPEIIFWNDKWSNYFDDHTNNCNSLIWTLFYPKSELTILLITDPHNY